MQGNRLSTQVPCARALRALAHPVTVAAVLLLLINDQMLRVRWPSWATGKLGDVAWLAFAPLVVALPLALLAPRLAPARSRRVQGRIALGAAVLSVGAIFAVIKALPAATSGFSSGFAVVFGWTPRIVCDPTDLLALPALGLAFWVWQRTEDRKPARGGAALVGIPGDDSVVSRSDSVARLRQGHAAPHPRTPRRAWVVLALAALATLGNSGPPDEGIVCLKVDGDRILAGPQHSYAFSNTFSSVDGGFTWTVVEEDRASEPDVMCDVHTSAWTVAGAGGEIVRFVPGRRIERSEDGGSQWISEMSLAGGDARLAYYQRARSNYGGAAGPHDALLDPATGNLIVAMGLEGVLVRPAVGSGAGEPATWAWQEVGPYRFEPVTGLAQLTTILQGEFGLAVAAGLISVALVGWRAFRWPLRTLSVLVALGITGAQLVFQPAASSNYGIMMAMSAVLISLAAAVIVGIVAAVLQIRRKTAPWWRLAILWLGAGLIYAAPFVLWVLGWIATYIAAAWIAVIIAIVAWAAAAFTGRAPAP